MLNQTSWNSGLEEFTVYYQDISVSKYQVKLKVRKQFSFLSIKNIHHHFIVRCQCNLVLWRHRFWRLFAKTTWPMFYSKVIYCLLVNTNNHKSIKIKKQGKSIKQINMTSKTETFSKCLEKWIVGKKKALKHLYKMCTKTQDVVGCRNLSYDDPKPASQEIAEWDVKEMMY